MKIGVGTFVTDEGIGSAKLAVALEERGFDALFLAEHSHIPASRQSPYPGGGELPRMYYRAVDPFVALAAAAAVTERLLLGTGVTLLIQRDVIHTAKEVATLDLISGGRFVFGVGAGWNREEMADHGTDPRTRGALLDEQLAALREIWTTDLAEFHGRFVDFDPMYAWPKPVQRPHPPIFIGGGPAAARRAARLGAGWFPTAVASPAEVPAQLAQLEGADVPVMVAGVAADPALLDAYAEAGVGRVSLMLPTLPESETLDMLDQFTKVAARFTS
ncbi:TIGR03619 family F420-dependent LLM class oxidoreductase [Nocardia sp. CDC159]|uniref:TIGR03619 family F420-dependent LLM class oxidoreductase n=1 Tax=Nocardia pulmonis TaxID=2951408 RepID=A0A9X2E0Z9_9NOCA|nr:MULTISPECIES: TIGR03619 family F420-dependent LLM class oxidoreductase [Nocardia]MCM6772154.1 TIGR03619 family F420-dependent LLM class oxidoreductase [Nocardia pulmonis]MCM6785188.1 TIGR03619 family F420-dependent LLM class oxidoreductase [Nocardia sp. CDC159]